MDDDFGYRIYALEKPLQPGDSLKLSFEVHVAPHGFRNVITHGIFEITKAPRSLTANMPDSLARRLLKTLRGYDKRKTRDRPFESRRKSQKPRCRT